MTSIFDWHKLKSNHTRVHFPHPGLSYIKAGHNTSKRSAHSPPRERKLCIAEGRVRTTGKNLNKQAFQGFPAHYSITVSLFQLCFLSAAIFHV